MAKREFFTGSVRVIADPRLSGLDHRTYACISMHGHVAQERDWARLLRDFRHADRSHRLRRFQLVEVNQAFG